ncbi:hypothetical protein QWY86_13990 [Pedobacter aquatilis]|uniref:hypothetical protein n=1 Tax=Pedobacter aquatilis TaxID=351343 RepID=UPI0025B4B1D5|nr:hypothetical protein [Pedobacter aquatilis]MDN3587789.1 hypothetical protein [Pedobacter aquatilis]
METDLIISEIDAIHTKIDQALEQKDSNAYLFNFDEEIAYKKADGTIITKADLTDETKRYFKNLKSVSTSHYRIKSSLEDEKFIEKIARKSVVHQSNLLIFSKKKTTQTEEIYQWKKFGNEWKVISVEITLEENY